MCILSNKTKGILSGCKGKPNSPQSVETLSMIVLLRVLHTSQKHKQKKAKKKKNTNIPTNKRNQWSLKAFKGGGDRSTQ